MFHETLEEQILIFIISTIEWNNKNFTAVGYNVERRIKFVVQTFPFVHQRVM